MIRTNLRNLVRSSFKKHPAIRTSLMLLDTQAERLRHTVATVFPEVIKPQLRNITIAITAHCNLRCIGCKYGRDFMPGSQLSWPVVRDLLDDAKEAGAWEIRFYGGEPLLHPDLSRMIEYCSQIGMPNYLTTNGILLKHKIDELYAAGLRNITVGFYGTGEKYDQYVQRKDRFREVEAGFAAVRERYGMDVNVKMNWLMMRPSCNIHDLRAAWEIAERYSMKFQVDLIHYSLPYFTEGPDRELQFRPEDYSEIDSVVAELVRLKNRFPERLSQSMASIVSIPNWLLKGSSMNVPCDAYQMIWVGADGTVQLCYVTFKLGNLHEKRLAEILWGSDHQRAARDAYSLNCPNCHCHYPGRLAKRPLIALN
jgi:molybdenum cofactor biosynthesis enzyme MoaA